MDDRLSKNFFIQANEPKSYDWGIFNTKVHNTRF